MSRSNVALSVTAVVSLFLALVAFTSRPLHSVEAAPVMPPFGSISVAGSNLTL